MEFLTSADFKTAKSLTVRDVMCISKLIKLLFYVFQSRGYTVFKTEMLLLRFAVIVQLIIILLFRSTPKSRPNNMGQMSVRPYVRPEKVFPIPMKFSMQVEVDE